MQSAAKLWGGEELSATTGTIIFPVNFSDALIRIAISVNDTNTDHQIVVASKSATRFGYLSNTANGTILYIVIGH